MMDQMTFIFGPGVEGLSIEDAARKSTRSYVRSEGEISIYKEHRRATGHQLTAWEAYSTFGLATLEAAAEYSGAILRVTPSATGNALRTRRVELGLTHTTVAYNSGVSPEEVELAESSPHDLSIHKILRIAFVLGLDERFIAFKEDPGGDSQLSSRLRTLHSDYPELVGDTPDEIVLLLAEATSVIRAQHKLEMWLEHPMESEQFHPVADHGSHPWEAGYNLAMSAREVLQLGRTPIPSLRELSEERLGIPVVQALLPDRIAGATLATTDGDGDNIRGIVLNSAGHNEQEWARQLTLAHAIGHVLYDSDDSLRNLRIEPHNPDPWDIQSPSTEYDEQRAQAFAFWLLARPLLGLGHDEVDRYHWGPVTVSLAPYYDIETEPPRKWVGLENLTVGTFPIGQTSELRQGRFAAVVATAYRQHIISAHTGALYLSCEVEDFQANSASLASRYNVHRSFMRRPAAG